MKKKAHEFDQHIVDALKNLPVPLLNFQGVQIYFDKNKRDESVFEHIANKKHHLHLSDISRIPLILKSEDSLMKDRKKSRRYKNYIGRRGKTNEKFKHLIIVTQVNKDRTESIISIYPYK